jgi:hypothetical protein
LAISRNVSVYYHTLCFAEKGKGLAVIGKSPVPRASANVAVWAKGRHSVLDFHQLENIILRVDFSA